ncbi:MAG: hypothetical protein WAU42_05720, partial [Solirubrobacteraceae bacterium]
MIGIRLAKGTGYSFLAPACPRACRKNELEKIPPAPTVATEGTSAVEAHSATVHGTLNPNTVDTRYRFDYGLSPTSYGASTPVPEGDAGSGSGFVEESSTIAGLASSTTYYYRMVGNSATGTSPGSPESFTTQAEPPTVSTGTEPEAREFGATLGGNVNPNGADTSYHFQYGRTTEYGLSTTEVDAGSGRSSTPVSATVSGLQANTTYHFRIVASNSSGMISRGLDHVFTTTQTKRVVPVLRENGEQYVWYRDQERRLHFWYWNGSKWSENYLGVTGAMGGEPTPVLHANGEQYVWYRGTDDALHFWYWNNVKWSENYLGAAGAMAGEPKVALRENGEQYVWYRGTDGALHFWYWNNSKWSENYLGVAGAMAGEPKVALRENGEQYVWYRSTDGALHFWYWNNVKWSEN